jgi:glycine cleavage system H protein
MRDVREGLKYSASHGWARVEPDGAVTLGITDHAQDALGSLVRVDPPPVGTRVVRGEPVGTVESSKATVDLYSPIAGEVVAVNAALSATPTIANREPYDGGWIFRVRPDDLDDLDEALDAEDYRELLSSDEE